MLASLAVLSLLSLLILAGLGWAGRMRTRIETVSGGRDGVAAAQSLLRDRIGHLVPAPRFGALSAQTDLDGQADTLSFLAAPLQNAGPGELQRYRLWLANDGRLALSTESDLAERPGQVTGALVLLSGVHAIDLAYFGAGAPDNVAQWRARWSQQATPPRLVRLRLAFAPGDSRRWPDLLVRPEATVDTACVVDVHTGGCKGRA